MIAHILGWLTVALDVGVTGYAIRYLWVTGTRPWSWQRPLPVPKTLPLHLDGGADYVGYV